MESSSLLRGLRILDCTRDIAGPVATMLAAEMGADVIKIEPPGGDEMRHWPPFVDGESVYFVTCNRGKRSIVVDLKTSEGAALFRRLLAGAHLIVENYRPGTLEKLGLGWGDLHDSHPRLVWVSVSGYGRSGPKAAAPAYDTMMQAFVGIMGVTGEPGRPPVRCAGSPIDIATAYLAFGAIMAGVSSAARTGRGSLFEVSLMESALGFMHAYLQAALVGLPLPVRMGSETLGIYPLGAFRCADGEYCLVQVGNDLQWRRFCALLGASALGADTRFADNPARVRNRDALRPILEAHLIERPARDWERLAVGSGVPLCHVRPLADVVADPQILARNMIKPVRLKGGREIPSLGVPLKIDGQLETRTLAVPGLDEHRDDILQELERQWTSG